MLNSIRQPRRISSTISTKQGFQTEPSANKSFLWSDDLPKGGFPKDLVEPRRVLEMANELERVGLLQSKTSCGCRKFGLGDPSVVKPILVAKSFESIPALKKIFERDKLRVTVRLLDYNDGFVLSDRVDQT